MNKSWARWLVVTLVMILSFFAVLVVVPLAGMLGVDPSELQSSDLKLTAVVILLLVLYSVISVVIPAVTQKWIHKKPVLSLGFRTKFWRNFGVGFAAGTAIVWTGFLARIVFSKEISIKSALPVDLDILAFAGSYLFTMVIILQLNSFKEEIVFRSYPIEQFADKPRQRWMMLVFCSVVFSVIHLVFEPFTWVGFLNRALAGILFCQFYLVSRSLWCVMGIHSAFNFWELTFTAPWRLGGIWIVSIEEHYSGLGDWLEILVLLIASAVVFWMIRKGTLQMILGSVNDPFETAEIEGKPRGQTRVSSMESASK